MPESTAGPSDSVNRAADAITEAATAAADRHIKRAVRDMTSTVRNATPTLGGFLLSELDDTHNALGRQLEGILTEATLAGELAGAATIAADVTSAAPSTIRAASAFFPPPRDPLALAELLGEPPKVRFPIVEDAVKTLKASPVAIGQDFRETARAVKDGSFAITADMTTDSLREVRTLLADNIATGPDREKFIRDIKETFEVGNPLSEARWRMTFRNNVGQALSDGQDRALKSPFVEDGFPYRRYVATNDGRVRPEHIALETLGMLGSGGRTNIYWKGDPVWQEFRPIWDYGCRCASFPVTVRMAMQEGVTEAVAWWERAVERSEAFGGLPEIHLSEAEPTLHELVPHPNFNAPPEFRRATVA